MKREFYYPSADERTQIHAIEWTPGGAPKAVLQIAHGMVEFIDRHEILNELDRDVVYADLLAWISEKS